MDDVRQELLMAFAAGRLAEPVTLAIATHVALNPKAHAVVRAYEELGGRFLEELEPEPLPPGSLDAVMALLDTPPVTPRPRTGIQQDPSIPPVLARYLPAPIDQLPWKRLGPVAEYPLLKEVAGYKTQLLRIQAGRKVPQHTHDGNELTVVLRGAYGDGIGHYARGDLSVADGSINHQPKADEGEECLCLAVTDARLRLTGTLGRLLNPFIRF
ncbi:MAG TPA: ChrR family anti-sigma-E factor [Geminicoccus sp.]|uniref:ChrR family anti-sigma-E factor n=1 Tax=Geminicoccus sp. TaxID=2024832 RepID=UPI002E363227|nr:ChrR family anti-sigma-E factor [Geminicoccus sp.]HEX2528056.1 ChrR family anti-sigma-E factor [Geminicoccus sp.]